MDTSWPLSSAAFAVITAAITLIIKDSSKEAMLYVVAVVFVTFWSDDW